jgi:hypothetical protein
MADDAYRSRTPAPQPSEDLQALAEAGRRQRSQHEVATVAALSKDEQRTLAQNVPPRVALRVAWMLVMALALVLCASSAVVALWLAPVLVTVWCAVLWWSYRHLAQRAIAQTLAWPDSLPFEVRGFRAWLTDSEPLRMSALLWFVFQDDAPKLVVGDVLATVLPEAAPSWFGARTVGLKLKHRYRNLASDSGSTSFAPDVVRLQQLASQVLTPLHASHPIAHIELNQESVEAYTTRFGHEFDTRCKDLASKDRDLAISAQISEIHALHGQTLDVPQPYREVLRTSFETYLRRIIIKAEASGDHERARTVTEAGQLFALDLSQDRLHEERLVMHAERR